MEWEWHADEAVKELRKFIDTEAQFVQKEHELSAKLTSWDYVMIHLNERIPENMVHLHQLNKDVSDKLLEIREFVESEISTELKILQEEQQLLQNLTKETRHRDWKLVKKAIITKEEEALKLEEDELKELHTKFIELMKIMKRSKLIAAIEEDLTVSKEKEKYEKLEEYYFLQIYKFARAYERIFRDLWRKERRLKKGLYNT